MATTIEGDDCGHEQASTSTAAAANLPGLQIFVPGRVCLFGEHSDWSGAFRRFNPSIEKGYTIVVGTNQGLYAEVRSHPTSLVVTCSDERGNKKGPVCIPMEPSRLLEVARGGGFWSYVAGVAYQILIDYKVSGIEIDNYKTDLPLKKGLSSSAAVCVLTARAFNRIYDLKMTTRGEMEYAYKGEILTPSQCGRMDQACAFGNQPVLMTYDGEFVDVEAIRLPLPLYLVIIDLCAEKDTVEILAKLQEAFPVASTATHEGVHEMLGARNKDITSIRAVEAIFKGDAQTLGKLMVEAQENMDKFGGAACPAQLTAPVLHRVIAHATFQPLIWGAKGVGAGGDGTAQFLCRGKEEQRQLVEIAETELGLPAMKLTVEASNNIRKAVIPCAGFGSDLFPAVKCTSAPLFPIVDDDGRTKPAILLNVDELIEAGIEEIYLIVQPDDLPNFEILFKRPLSRENYAQLDAESQALAKHILAVGEKVRFIVQDSQEGFGHAVRLAKECIGDEAFMLVLGDHLYKSTGAQSCARQVLQQYKVHNKSVVGLKKTPLNSVKSYGTATGNWIPGEKSAMTVTRVCEKPSTKFAKQQLRLVFFSFPAFFRFF